MESLLSIAEAATVLGISPHTVKAYVRDGKIASLKIGRRRLIEPETVRAFIEAGKEKQDNGTG